MTHFYIVEFNGQRSRSFCKLANARKLAKKVENAIIKRISARGLTQETVK